MKKITIGNRIPKDFFITKGFGASDVDRHTGSYHLCLNAAGIDCCNIITYSSILPAIANKLEMRYPITHGEVAECIIAECDGRRGELLSCGIIYGFLYDKETNQKYGGLVCERYGNCFESKIIDELNLSLNELYTNGYSDKYELRDIEMYTNTAKGTKTFNTIMVCIVFQTYEIEIKEG